MPVCCGKFQAFVGWHRYSCAHIDSGLVNLHTAMCHTHGNACIEMHAWIPSVHTVSVHQIAIVCYLPSTTSHHDNESNVLIKIKWCENHAHFNRANEICDIWRNRFCCNFGHNFNERSKWSKTKLKCILIWKNDCAQPVKAICPSKIVSIHLEIALAFWLFAFWVLYMPYCWFF